MQASSSAIDSAFSPHRPKILAADPYEVTKRTLQVVILAIAMPEQDCVGVLDPLPERREAVRVRLLTVLGEVPEEKRKGRPIRTEPETCQWKIRRRFENTKGSWIHATIFGLLAGCCAITFFFVFQPPFRLRANENQANTGDFRTEIAALPIRSAAQTISDFRAQRSRRSGSDDRELASSFIDDSGPKRRLPRERLIQRKQPRVHIESAEFSSPQ
jgi:hypothetical protein